ncbi:MAG: diguanylate cyclase [Nitrospiraceae bacterium]|nr:MAG: diguanylate cyclase [Nitrospiraceae bacterium]
MINIMVMQYLYSDNKLLKDPKSIFCKLCTRLNRDILNAEYKPIAEMGKNPNITNPVRDLLIIIVFGGLVYSVAVLTEAHEVIDTWVGDRRFAGLHLDEVFILLIYCGFAFAVFGMRRWREASREIVLRKQTEAYLQESESKFRNLSERSVAGIYLIQDDKFRYVNPVLARIFGYSVTEMKDILGPEDVTLPVDWPLVRENLRKRVSGESDSANYSFRGIKKNRDVIHVEVYGSRTQFLGRPAVIGTLLDITDRIRAAERLHHALEESQRRQNEISAMLETLKQREEQLIRQSYDLAARNADISILYKVSSAINRTIDMDELFPNILNTIFEIDLLKVERKGGIFLVNGDKMTLIAHTGCQDNFTENHRNMKVGMCLCGLVAETGEIIISENSDNDCLHTLRYPGMACHGHIILPLKTADTVVGVLFLYLPANSRIDEKIMQTLISVGNLIGIAISNSLLYEDTKTLSLRDPLTKVANRNLMNVELEKNFARAKRFESPLSVIMLDLDNFKKFNDTYGHTAGDKLLVDTAAILLKEVRETDVVVRYGGEEFLVLLPEAEIGDACEIAERIRKSVEDTAGVTISIGIAAYSSGIQKGRDLIKKADEALYHAKRNGKNRVEVYKG